jgi:hypothetical protein
MTGLKPVATKSRARREGASKREPLEGEEFAGRGWL